MRGVSKSLPPTKRMPHGVSWPSRCKHTENSCNLGLMILTIDYDALIPLFRETITTRNSNWNWMFFFKLNRFAYFESFASTKFKKENKFAILHKNLFSLFSGRSSLLVQLKQKEESLKYIQDNRINKLLCNRLTDRLNHIFAASVFCLMFLFTSRKAVSQLARHQQPDLWAISDVIFIPGDATCHLLNELNDILGIRLFAYDRFMIFEKLMATIRCVVLLSLIQSSQEILLRSL